MWERFGTTALHSTKSCKKIFDIPNAQFLLDTLISSVLTLIVEGDLLLEDQEYVGLLGGNPLWKVVSPIDSLLSRVRQAQAHVISDSALCLGITAMKEASDKGTSKWSDSQKHGGTTASRGTDSKFLNCTFHV